MNEDREFLLHAHITNDKCLIRMLWSYRDGLSILNGQIEIPADLAAVYNRVDALEYLPSSCKMFAQRFNK